LYAFAGYRLLPGLQQIYNAFTQMRFSEHALDSLYNEFKNLESLGKVSKNLFFTSTNKSITLNNISFCHPNNKKMTLSNVSLSIPFYSTVGIVGPTGSGKTTLVDIILGLINPTEGTLSVDSDIINNKSKLSWGKIIGYVPQRINLIDSSINDKYIKCYVSKQKGFIKYIEKKHIKNDISTFKVITARAAHAANSSFGNMFIGCPNEVCSQSYILFEVKTLDEANSLLSYMKCKLPNFMLILRKISQDINEATCKWIPLVPLNKELNDDEIYKFFNLTNVLILAIE
jgi:ABC-type antimicrobial peptide transport system ATPase subunit